MSEGTQPATRRYDSSGRQARAAEVRREILRAAHDLFVAHGYTATTMADIAVAAGVSTPTVYATGTKAALLKSCVDLALVGDDAAVPVADRPITQWVLDTPDANELLSRYAVMMGELAARSGPIYDVVVRAADSDPDIATLLADYERQRLRAATTFAEAVASRNGLPPGRTITEARDTIWICIAPELYVTLTRKRRWSTRRYVEWSRNTLLQLITAEPAAGNIPHRTP
ncbi:MAG: TetR/AcrR family transcriptional regulator [Ilumatobacteraceae bacterium]